MYYIRYCLIYIYIYMQIHIYKYDMYVYSISACPPLGGTTRLRRNICSQTVTFVIPILRLSISCQSYCHLVKQVLG